MEAPPSNCQVERLVREMWPSSVSPARAFSFDPKVARTLRNLNLALFDFLPQILAQVKGFLVGVHERIAAVVGL